MICERCDSPHDGSYGSGRFCKSYCARGFSTAEKRDLINQKVRAKITGVKTGYRRRTAETNECIAEGIRRFYSNRTFDQLGAKRRCLQVIKEQDGKCLLCGLDEWLGGPIFLEVDHINGNHQDWSRENLRALCRNCHAQTPTYGHRKRTPV